MIDLHGRTALVTGGSRGIGAATCVFFAQAGADVLVHYAREVAGAIAFLASDLAAHITGEVLNVNGGSVLCG